MRFAWVFPLNPCYQRASGQSIHVGQCCAFSISGLQSAVLSLKNQSFREGLSAEATKIGFEGFVGTVITAFSASGIGFSTSGLQYAVLSLGYSTSNIPSLSG